MASPAWHARIDIGGAVEGSGFLVSDRAVLTCAHVVRSTDRAEVVFPGSPYQAPVPARVAGRGGWAGGDRDPGDVAVLELERPVDIAPAGFAGLDEAYAARDRKLVAYGFPYGYDEEGVQSELRVTSSQLIRDEWSQLEFWRGYGQEPARGFSGAAVMLEHSGTVAGMVSAHDPTTRNGRMIPVHVLARHWPPLADLVPTPGYPAEEKRWLRELVARTPVLTEPVGPLLRAAIGPLGVVPPGGRIGSLWEAVWYLLSESPPRPDGLPLADLAVRVSGLVGDRPGPGRELLDWARAHRARHEVRAPAAPAPAPERATGRWSPILVEIRRSGADRGALVVEVSAYRNGSRRLVGEERLPRARVREWVLDRIDRAFGEIDSDGQELIGFALPRGWLNQPVDQWARRRGRDAPLGCRAPVVVMDHDRRSNDRLQFRLRKVWNVLEGRDSSPVHRIECGSTHRPDRLSAELQEVYGPVGLSRPPRAPRDKALHRAVLEAPAPIVLWPRVGCEEKSCEGSCPAGSGFLDVLAERLAALPPSLLPQFVMKLRLDAFLHKGPDPHWAADFSFVWEDPRWFPAVPRLSRSPVG
ncbi:trypsin-like peptidase domain-containing protein [Streptomyces sp. NPDC000410]|uniref:VMAP-C domain-containing protein n=1 Tax=Streptomyces sp. NPDC000410 TaxID=3154254 RepID=UPI00332DD8C2